MKSYEEARSLILEDMKEWNERVYQEVKQSIKELESSDGTAHFAAFGFAIKPVSQTYYKREDE